MASIIDLTSDSDESPTTSSLNRQSNTLNRRNKNSTNPTQSSMESTLEKAIDRMNEASLRTLLKKVCAQNATAKILVQSEVLVPSNEVKPYHADTDSEDRDESEDESEEDEDNEESGEDGEDSSTEVVANPIPRQRNGRQCFRCPEAIYDDMNEEGDCVGHTGRYLTLSLIKLISLLIQVFCRQEEGQPRVRCLVRLQSRSRTENSTRKRPKLCRRIQVDLLWFLGKRCWLSERKTHRWHRKGVRKRAKEGLEEKSCGTRAIRVCVEV